MSRNKKTRRKLMEEVQAILARRGQKAFAIAKNSILQEKIEYKPVHDALQYFIQEIWHNFQHPALLSLTCEFVGGKPEKTTAIGAALVLLTGAADIHDDIIDHSEIKGSKPTILGKFGMNISLLVGDALLLKGATLLHSACDNLPKKQRAKIITLVKEAFFEIGMAEAREASLKGKLDVVPEEYLDIIEMKAAIADATARIGAILGEGSSEEIEALGRYGRTLGILAAVRDEFIDTFEPAELKNRAENECLPLPLLYVLRNREIKKKITSLLHREELTEEDALKIAKTINETEEIKILKKKMLFLLNSGVHSIEVIRKSKTSNILSKILYAGMEDL
jgi:geranylgeranyl pyrophosphate synthase